MKYFITGSTGFIGLALTLKLAREGHTVNALVRSKQKANHLNHPNIQLYYGTVQDSAILEEAINGTDGIFHLAAFAQPWAKRSETYNEINAKATRRIYEIAQAKGVPRIVFTSSAGTIGPSENNTPVNEETVRSVDFFNEYESTKFIAEKITKDFVLKGMDIVIVHPSRVYGPGHLSKSNAVTMMIKNYISGKWRIIPGDGNKMGNYAFIDDVVEGHLLTMKKGIKGEQYILGGENVTYSQFFNLLKQVSNKNYFLFKIPVWTLVTFAAIQMQLARLFGKIPLLPPKWVKKYLYDWSVSSNKAINELGYSITPLEEGYKQTIQWLKNNKKS